MDTPDKSLIRFYIGKKIQRHTAFYRILHIIGLSVCAHNIRHFIYGEHIIGLFHSNIAVGGRLVVQHDVRILLIKGAVYFLHGGVCLNRPSPAMDEGQLCHLRFLLPAAPYQDCGSRRQQQNLAKHSLIYSLSFSHFRSSSAAYIRDSLN